MLTMFSVFESGMQRVSKAPGCDALERSGQGGEEDHFAEERAVTISKHPP